MEAPSPITLNERRTDKAVIVEASGRIDMVTEGRLRAHLLPLVSGKKAEIVVLDFSGVQYISSAGLRVLMIAAKDAKTSGSKIAVAALQPHVNEIFEISRFNKVIPCHATVDEAIAALSAS
jgi:anti-anti-sigma factor